MPVSLLRKLSPGWCFIALLATTAVVAATVHDGSAETSSSPPNPPTNLVVTSPRICAALSVYELAQENDWGLRATVAQATLNGFTVEGRVPDCAAGVGVALTTDFEPARWQLALDAVDAVSSGSYAVSPDACARANTVVPLSAEATSPVAARAQCVIYGLAFVEVRP